MRSVTAAGPDGGSPGFRLYCAMSPQTGTRAKGLRSGRTAWNTAPPTFSK